jgi:HEAT repeat protein
MRHLVTALLFAATLNAQEFTNASIQRHAASRGVASAVRSIAGSGDAWIAWSAPVAERFQICCSGWNKDGGGCCGGCTLTKWANTFNIGDDSGSRHYTTTMMVVARIEDGTLSKVRLFDAACPVKGDGTTVHVLDDVTPASSIEYLAGEITRARDESTVLTAIAQHDDPSMVPTLERLAGTSYNDDIREHAVFWIGQRGGERGFRFLRDIIRGRESISLQKKAVFSMSQNKAEGATDELIAIARQHMNSTIRREAIFWLGQKAGAKAAGELRRAVDEDPDDDVREHAVFAISQLPRERSVPLLIDLARNHKSKRVREKAIFWLTQTGDPRALDLIEEILTK